MVKNKVIFEIWSEKSKQVKIKVKWIFCHWEKYV